MSDITKRFSDEAKRVLSAALANSRELGHTYIGSEHLLLGILQEEGSAPCKLLSERGCRYEDMRSRVIGIVGMGCKSHVTSEDLTPVCKKIVLRASVISKSVRSQLVGIEHIFMSLLREECVGTRLLENCDVDINELSAIFEELYGGECDEIEFVPEKIKKLTPLLDKNALDLTDKARRGKIDPVIGRSREEERLISILLRRSKNNPCLIGEAGVGKTAIVESVASRIAEGNVPAELRDARIMSLELSMVVAGTKYRGEFEEKIKGIIEEAKDSDDVILFIDEIHTIVGAGAAEGAIDASNILKPALARGEIRLIGATTPKEYKRSIEHDAALERRFQPIDVPEPDESACVDMIMGIKRRYESFHGVVITDAAVKDAVSISARYISDRCLPDKAIDLIDEAAARKKISETGRAKSLITSADIAASAEERTGIPLSVLSKSRGERLMNLEADIKRRLIGQDAAVNALCPAVRRAYSGVRGGTRPCGSFLFVGQSGVGKTECARSLAETVFCSDKAFLRLDMSEYSEPHSVAKLIGSPPGYVGFGEGGVLTERVRKHPYSLLLFDEIEKAHPDVRALLLQILDDGHLTDSAGTGVSFANTTVILTANLQPEHSGEIGFTGAGRQSSAYETAKKLLPPELVDRVDEIIVFSPLSEEAKRKIAESKLDLLASHLSSKGISVSFDESFLQAVAEEARGRSARSISRIAVRRAEDVISSRLLTEGIDRGHGATLFFENGGYLAKIKQISY